jgi:hypothetical protein
MPSDEDYPDESGGDDPTGGERTDIGPIPIPVPDRGAPRRPAAVARPVTPGREPSGPTRNGDGPKPSVREAVREPVREAVRDSRRPAARPPAASTAADEPKARFWPAPPRNELETGLAGSAIEELILKHLFQASELRGTEVAHRTKLPTSIVDEALERMRRAKQVDIKGAGGGGIGRSAMIYVLAEAGQAVVRHALERDRYVGPAPVRFERYVESVGAQSIRGNQLRKADIARRFTDLVVKDDVFDAIGPAMNSGKALFFYGPPGNGKTAVCQRMTDCFGGDVFIPYAITVDDFVVKVFDDTVHKPVPLKEGEPGVDERWIRIKRPMLVVGGELTLEQLDLAYSSEVKFYEAPFQMKSNCGMLLVDDFGRQKVSPKDLLNRWIVPLESEFDFLTLHTGKKLKVPFDVFVVFSTNLDPQALVDQAFLRRVRYKLEVKRPEEPQYRAIFRAECRRRGIAEDPAMLDYLIQHHYKEAGRPMNACEPRDLLGQVVDLCAYLGEAPHLSEDVLDRVTKSYFVRFDQVPA